MMLSIKEMEDAMNYKSNILYSGLLSILLLTLGLLFASPAYSDDVLKIGGVGSALGSMKILGEAFEKSHPDISVRIFPSLGSSGGIKAVNEGSMDIGLSGRQLKNEEHKSALSVMLYAKTPFILVANKYVKISNLTTGEIINIYTGENQAWPDGERIRLILRPAIDSDTLIIKKISPEMSRALEAALSREGMLVAMTDQENVDLIEKTPGAVGFSTLTQITTEMRALKILSYNGIQPSVSALAKKSYPLLKPLFIVTKRKPTVQIRKFLDFIKSSEGRALLQASGNLFVTGDQGKQR